MNKFVKHVFSSVVMLSLTIASAQANPQIDPLPSHPFPPIDLPFPPFLINNGGLVQKVFINGGPEGLNGYGYIIFPAYENDLYAGGPLPYLDLTIKSPEPPYGLGKTYHTELHCCETGLAGWTINPTTGVVEQLYMQLTDILDGAISIDIMAIFSLDVSTEHGASVSLSEHSDATGELDTIRTQLSIHPANKRPLPQHIMR